MKVINSILILSFAIILKAETYVLPLLVIDSVYVKKDRISVETTSRFRKNIPGKLLVECADGSSIFEKEAVPKQKILFGGLKSASEYSLTPCFVKDSMKFYGQNFRWVIKTLPDDVRVGEYTLEEVYISRQCRFTISTPKNNQTRQEKLEKITRSITLINSEENYKIQSDRIRVRYIYSTPDKDLFLAECYPPPHGSFEFRMQTDPTHSLRYIFSTPPFLNFSWCNFPLNTPKMSPLFNGQFPQDIVHPSVVFSEEKILGHHIWCVATPWPQIINSPADKIFGELYENPCVFYADSDTDNSIPTAFHSIANNPIVERKDAHYGFNSDPDILFVNNRLYCITRQRNYNIPQKITNRFILQYSDDGFVWSKPIPVLKTGKGDSQTRSLSPMLIYKNNCFYCYLIERTPDNVTVKSIDIYKAEDISRPDALKFFKHGTWSDASISNWHGDIFEYKGEFFMIFNTVNGGATYLAYAPNGCDWIVYPLQIFDCSSSYHPTAFIRKTDNHLIVFTSYLGTSGFSKKYPTGHRIAFHDIGNFSQILKELQSFVKMKMSPSLLRQ